MLEPIETCMFTTKKEKQAGCRRLTPEIRDADSMEGDSRRLSVKPSVRCHVR
jgi:hypothetical protein